MEWHCEHMCDDGINETVNVIVLGIRRAIEKTISEAKEKNVKNLDEYSDFLESMDDDDIAVTVEKHLTNVVENIDEHCQYVADNAVSCWLDNQDEYVRIEDIDVTESDEYSAIVEELEEAREERDDALEEKDELSREISELKGPKTVSYNGFTLTWVDGKGKFICKETGRVFELTETEDLSISGIV